MATNSVNIAKAIPEIEAMDGSNEAKMLKVIPAAVPENKELKNLYLIKFLLFILNFLEIIGFSNKSICELLRFVLLI